MKRLSRALSAALLLATATSGCVGHYFKHRVRDFFDPVTLDLAGGAGLGVQARASVIHTGFGYAQMYHWGLLDGVPGKHNPFGLRPEFHADFLVYSSEGTMTGWPNALADQPLKATWTRREHVDPHLCWFVHAPHHPTAEPAMRWHEILDVKAGVNAGLVGARAGVSPGELLDFVLGWFGIDIAGDDKKPESRSQEPEVRSQNKNAK